MTIAQTGAVSQEEISHARDAVRSAQAALDAAQQQLASNRALTSNTTIASHPNVLAAAAKVRDAYLNNARNTLPAPVTGYVAKRSVQVGQRVSPGNPLMAIVPLNGVWVDANFKEVQLKHMRIGQPVELTADVYGSSRRVPRQGDRLLGRHRLGVLAAAGAKRHRQLDQGRAASAGARSRSTRRNWKSIRCASACR